MIGRLWRLIRAEALKLRRRPLGLAPFALAALGAAAAVGWHRLALRPGAGELELRVLPTAWWALPAALQWGVGAGGLALVIVAAMSLAEERELGTAKILYAKPVRRAEVVAAKALVLLASTLAVILIAALIGFALGWSIWGAGDVVDAAYPDFVHHPAGAAVCEIDGVRWCLPRQSLMALALLVPPLFGLLMIALMLGSLVRQTGIAVGLAFGALLIGEAAAWLSDAAAPWVVNSYLHFPIDTLHAYVNGESTRLWAERWRDGTLMLPLGLVVSGLSAAVAAIASATVVTLRPVLGILWLLAASLTIAAEPVHAAEIHFRIQDLRAPGQVWWVRPADVDGDGDRDLVAFVVRGGFGPDPQRFLAFFMQARGRFSPEPDAVVAIPPSAIAGAVLDLLPEAPGAEIVLFEARGCTVVRRVEGRYRLPGALLFRDTGFFDMGSGNQLPDIHDFIADLDGDGRREILFPRKRDVAIWRAGTGGFEAIAHLPLEHRQRYGSRTQERLLGRFLDVDARVRRPVLARLDPDGRLDVVTFRERRLEAWLQRPDGGFDRDPSWRAELPMISEDGERKDELNRVHAEIADVDGDRYADLIVYRNIGTVGVFSSMRTQVFYFRGRKGGWRTRRPAQIINLAGLSIDPVLIDIDGDGKRDLVLSSVRTDLITNVKRALFRSVEVTYAVYRFDAERRRFAASPSYAREIDVDVARIEGGATVPLAYFWGDYDGDGLHDMLSLATDDEVVIYPARRRKGGWLAAGAGVDFPQAERVRLALETSNSLWIEDVNGDGRHDLIFHYWADDYKRTERGKITVVSSQ